MVIMTSSIAILSRSSTKPSPSKTTYREKQKEHVCMSGLYCVCFLCIRFNILIKEVFQFNFPKRSIQSIIWTVILSEVV